MTNEGLRIENEMCTRNHVNHSLCLAARLLLGASDDANDLDEPYPVQIVQEWEHDERERERRNGRTRPRRYDISRRRASARRYIPRTRLSSLPRTQLRCTVPPGASSPPQHEQTRPRLGHATIQTQVS